jgi:glutamine amidotransferase
MCRLFALVAEHPKSSELPDLMVPFRAEARYHPHGWGIGWYFNGGVQVEKAPTAANEDPRFVTTCMSADSNIIIAHLRKGSVGGYTPDNTHPFSYGRFLFGHNGTVHTKRPIPRMLPPEYRGRILGQTDSEQMFHWILYHIDRHRGDAVHGIMEAITYLKGHQGPETTSYNFVMSDGEKVYAYRSTYCNPEHYSLMYRVREETDRYPGRSVIISSQRLSRGEWTAIDNGQMLVVDKLLHLSKYRF